MSARVLRSRWAPLPPLFLLCVLMFGLTWMRWPDVLIDFGIQLYTPWQLSQGRLLYRDVASLYGPFSPYFNAALFFFTGPSLHALAWLNFALFLALISMLYAFVSAIAGRGAAAVGCVLVILLCGFTQHVSIGTYQFMAPYSHGATHGFILAVAAMVAFGRFLRTGRHLHVALSGLCVGMTVLCKPEPCLAAFVAVGVGLFLAGFTLAGRREVCRAWLIYGAALVTPALVATLLFAPACGWATAVRYSLAAWVNASNPALRNIPLYRRWMGTDHAGASLAAMGLSAIWLGLLIAALAGGAMALARLRTAWRVLLMLAVSAGVLFLLTVVSGSTLWTAAGRPFPVVLLVLLALQGRSLRRHFERESILRMTAVLFALLMLARMGLNTRIYHFGFVLAIPAILCLTVALGRCLPERLPAGAGRLMVMGLLLWASVFVALWQFTSYTYYARKTFAVGSGSNRFYTHQAGPYIKQTVQYLDKVTDRSETVAVLPDSVMINYLARRAAPTRFIQFMPSEFAAFGEKRIVAAFKEEPPDAVVLVHRDTSEYGPHFFGTDYGQALGRWLAQRYPVRGQLVGGMPFNEEGRFGILVLLPSAAGGGPATAPARQ